MMMSGVISDTIGMLPAMKITDPYSPMARANASAKPVMSAGSTIGSITRRKIDQRDAPRVAAASSSSRGSSSSTGCTVRTTNGRPMNVNATSTPSGVNATLMPSGSSSDPIQPLAANNPVSAMPATAVGSANGKSTSASANRRPGNRYRTSTHATSSPKTVLIIAAPNDAPN